MKGEGGDFGGLGKIIKSQIKEEGKRSEARRLETEAEKLAHLEKSESEIRDAFLNELKILLREKLGNDKEKWIRNATGGYAKEKIKRLAEIDDAKNLALDVKFSENPKIPGEYLIALDLGVRVPTKDGSEGFGEDVFDPSGNIEERIFEILKQDNRFNPELLEKVKNNLHRQALLEYLAQSLDSTYLQSMIAGNPQLADEIHGKIAAVRRELLKYPEQQKRPF